MRKRTKVRTVFFFFFFFLLKRHFSRWVAVAVNSSRPPLLLSGSVWRQILWFPESQWTCKDSFYMRKREKKIHSIFFLPELYNHFKMDQCYCASFMKDDLNPIEPKRTNVFSFFQSAYGQKPETWRPLQCSCGLQAAMLPLLLSCFKPANPLLVATLGS